MDGNTPITIGLLIAIAGAIYGYSGFQAKRDSKKVQEGKAQGILESTLKTMDETLKSIRSENERFQKDHREEHIQLDKRVTDVERFVIEQKVKHKRKNSDIEE
jgi:hypothetical protein